MTWTREHGARVRALRKRAKMTQFDLAERMWPGSPNRFTDVSHIERASRNVTQATVELLAEALGVTPEALVPAGRSASGTARPRARDPLKAMSDEALEDLYRSVCCERAIRATEREV